MTKPPSSGGPQRAARVPAPAPPLPLSEIYRGRNVFILGSTGFVGKVLLSMLLDRFPDIGRAYVMVRRGSGTEARKTWRRPAPASATTCARP